ncbi:MAG: hypothetical protein SBU_000446 [Candidatus Syntrophoarchaeum butanivorans]|uniref:DNA-3-methyladenine glycosylase 2 family protein n=2 Tax=Candidatus Syntropharchaeum butanivorans TaxID=1839936 RepID=A0A1F2P5A3_9EURY|nr:MAG: hypothetical protein SBU_000446 [Candidatus Syntrophoarchaeum butanivorans]
MVGWFSMRARFERRFGPVLEAAREGERRCLRCERWGGDPVLMVVDAALDSIGLSYFNIVVPRVRRFYEVYVRDGRIRSFEDLAGYRPDDRGLLEILNNRRAWGTAIQVADTLERMRRERGLRSDLDALCNWAHNTSYLEWRNDPVGQIKGVGLITFQYLRMQAGVDTSMPDKIIKRVVEREFGVRAPDDLSFIREMEELSRRIGYSQILICWAIWLRESDMGRGEWEIV